jgi:RNA polymerase sigma factor (sigma-70 family)
MHHSETDGSQDQTARQNSLKQRLDAGPLLDEVYRFLRRVAPSRFRRAMRTQARYASQGATDMVHRTMEAFIRRLQAEQSAPAFSQIQCARAYALQLLVWTTLDYQRERRRRLERLQLASEQANRITAAAIDDAQHQLIVAELLDKLFDTDAELAKIVVMRATGQFSNDQIADELGISRATLYRRLAEGKDWLERHLGHSSSAQHVGRGNHPSH